MKPQPWKVVYGGREFIGEVIQSESWHPELAQLPPQLPFRIVQLQRFQQVPLEAVADPRLCLMVPGPRVLREKGLTQGKEKTALFTSGQILTSIPLFSAQVLALPDERRKLDLIATGLLYYGELVGRAKPQALGELRSIIPEMVRASLYLEAVELPPGELALDRVAILEQLNSVNLLENPQLWGSIKALFSWFQGRYRSLYLNFHSQYSKELASLRGRLEAAQPRLRALVMLNAIPELGEPVGVGLAVGYRELLRQVTPCPDSEVSVEEAPFCSSCGLHLSQEPPSREVGGFLDKLEASLQEQYRRLASEAIGLILSQQEEEGVDQFIKVLRSSDPSPLVQVLDDRLVAFLRQLLQEAQAHKVPFSLLPWLQRFPWVEEGEIKAALRDLEQQLQESLEQAKRETGGKQVRLIFTLENETHRRTRQSRPKPRPEPA